MESEIAIMGAGPAGSVLAARLRRLGFDVALIDLPRRFHAIEGLSERAVKGLEFAGFDAALSALGPRVPRTANWNGERRQANREWIVDRPALDAGLVADAARHGVRVVSGRASRYRRDGRRWRVTVSGAGTERSLCADFLVDARGRGSRRTGGWIAGPRTFAIARRYRSSSSRAPCTAVVTRPSGWFWLADDGARQALAQFFVSAETSTLPPRPEIEHYLARELTTLDGADDGWTTLEPLDRVSVRDAGTALRRTPLAEGFACVGDAVLAVDPLAGHGIYEALSGALALAPVINTLLRFPHRRQLAERFYQDKLEHDFWRLARTGRDFYRTESRWRRDDFWRERSVWPDDLPAHPPLSREPPMVASRPVSDNDTICERRVFVTSDHPRGVWRVAGVPLAELQQLALSHEGGCEALTTVAARRLDAPAEHIDAALGWLRHRGLLAPAH